MPARFHPPETREKQSSVASDQTERNGNLPSDTIDRSTTSPSKIDLHVQHAKLDSHLPQGQSSLAPKTQHPSSLPALIHHHHNIQSTTHRDTDSASPLTHITGKEQKPLPFPDPPPAPSDFAPPPFASEPRSPPNRRPPASRSSYGIETSSGPPPALSTQLSSPTEKTWKHATGVFSRLGSRKRTIESLAVSIHGGPTSSSWSKIVDPIKGLPPNEQSPKQTLPIMNTKGMAHDRDNPDDGQGESTLKGSDFPKLPFAISPKSRSGPGHAPSSPQEDLFHNLAHDPAGNEMSAGTSPKARRSTRLSLSNGQSSLSNRPTSAPRPKSGGRAVHQQRPSSSKEPASPQWPSVHALSTEPLETNGQDLRQERPYAVLGESSDRKRYYPPKTSLNASRTRKSSTRGTSPDLRSTADGRQYITGSPGSRLSGYRQRGHLASASAEYDSSPLNAYSTAGSKPWSRRGSHAEGTASTVSTTAPSTVWEELSDLRNRLNKLELTGQSLGSGNRNGIRERHSTATTTTTMTTSSSSPKHDRLRNGSTEATTVKGIATKSTHPLLHAALERSKDVMSPKVFEALEATASDALALAAVAGDGDLDGDVDGSFHRGGIAEATNRPLRRKADSLCRSLTELCIALSDAKETDSLKLHPESRDTARHTQANGITPEDDNRSVNTVSLEPEQTRASSRVMSRFEARRTSMQAQNASAAGRGGSSLLEPTTAPTQQPLPTPPSRTSSVLLRRRTDDGDRPLSRAMTQISHSSQQRPSPSERINRGYTSHHPLPQLSPSTAVPQRNSSKSYFSSPRWSPANAQPTSGGGVSSRRYLDTSATTTPPENSRLRMLASAQSGSGGPRNSALQARGGAENGPMS